jgi:cytochrome c-type biogenesis protein CcmF
VIAEIGHFALVLALTVALVQAVMPLAGAAKGHAPWLALARPAALAQFALVAAAFLCLTWLYVVSDFSVANVAQNSHSAKPTLYKVAGVWGNHEGSLLLWILILTLFGAAVALFGANLPAALRARVLAVQAMIGVGFLAFILFTSNPFLRLDPAPADGNGLNPLLQDPGLAFHPPFLYLGYVGFSMAFAFAVAALIEGRVDPAWARWVRRWPLLAWCFLTVGIALGSWWAYYELGWGGWWFWDPVENASFMPWLAGTALLHSAIVVEKRDTLKSWTILLAILTFSLSLLGTFIVRSGVLNSVHAFASDPARGVFILGFLVLVVGGSLGLYAWRAPALKPGGLFAPVSREAGLVLNNLLLATATGAVLLGTLYPLFLDALTGAKVSVGPPYYNAVFVPLMAPLVAVMAVGPLLAWKRADLAGALARLKVAAAITAAAVLVSWWLLAEGPLLALVGMALGVWLLAGTLSELAERFKLFRAPPAESWNRARHLPRAAWGMSVAHLGMALVLLGITVSTTWSVERQQVMRPGESVAVGPYTYTFLGTEEVRGPNYSATRGRFRAVSGGTDVALWAETRRYARPPMETTEAAIRPSPVADLYAVVGEADGKGGNATRLYWKPMVSWIWLGAFVMVLGGLVSLSDRRHRVGAPRRREIAAAAQAGARA